MPLTHIRAYCQPLEGSVSMHRREAASRCNQLSHTGIATPVLQYFPAPNDQMKHLLQSILSYFFSVDHVEVWLRSARWDFAVAIQWGQTNSLIC